MVWPTLHFPIFLADWLGDSAIWCILSIKEIYQVFIQAYKPFTTSKTFKNFQSRAMWFDPYCPFKKKKEKDRTAFNLRFTYQKFYPETIYTLKYFIQNSTKSTIHFFLYLHHFRKIESQYWFTHKKRKVNFFQKHVWFELRCIFWHV